jgi:hypothetical protein
MLESITRVTTVHLRSVSLVTVRGRWNDDTPKVMAAFSYFRWLWHYYSVQLRREKLLMNARTDSAQCALAPITNKYRIRMDHLPDLAMSFHLEFFEGSDTQL